MSLSNNKEQSTTKLYRALDEIEYHQLIQTYRFNVVDYSVEGKYFAECVEHALIWGDAFYGLGNYRVIEIQFPSQIADQFYRWEFLDGIGPARFAEIQQLQHVDFIVRGVL